MVVEFEGTGGTEGWKENEQGRRIGSQALALVRTL